MIMRGDEIIPSLLLALTIVPPSFPWEERGFAPCQRTQEEPSPVSPLFQWG